jgi:glucosamine--fructose-6-phosphate aminotransferase (isomerizing)
LREIPGLIEQTLGGLGPVLPRVERYRYMDRCAVIGRGYNYATAFEIALKIKELTRTVAEPYSSADFRHGPIAMVRDGFPVLAIAPSGAVSSDMQALVADLQKLDSELLLIADDPALLEQAHLGLPLPPGLPEWLTPLVAVLPGQLFSLALARAKGLDPDQPLGLKKVTETL